MRYRPITKWLQQCVDSSFSEQFLRLVRDITVKNRAKVQVSKRVRNIHKSRDSNLRPPRPGKSLVVSPNEQIITTKTKQQLMSLKTTEKAFSRVNRQGKVIRIIREHYLRDDITCNSKECYSTTPLTTTTATTTSSDGDSSCSSSSSSCSCCKHVGIPVLDAVPHSNSPYVVRDRGGNTNNNNHNNNGGSHKNMNNFHMNNRDIGAGGADGGELSRKKKKKKQAQAATQLVLNKLSQSEAMGSMASTLQQQSGNLSKKEAKKKFKSDFPVLESKSVVVTPQQHSSTNVVSDAAAATTTTMTTGWGKINVVQQQKKKAQPKKKTSTQGEQPTTSTTKSKLLGDVEKKQNNEEKVDEDIVKNVLNKVDEKEEEEEEEDNEAEADEDEIDMSVHYLVPTVNLVWNYIEMFEVNQFSNIIFCETILSSEGYGNNMNNLTSHRRLTQRVRAIVNDTALRRSILFCNEHSKDTYVERLEHESQKDRDNRAVATVAEWYRTHLSYRVPIVLLTLNDAESEQFKDIGHGVIVKSIEQYINDPKLCSQVSVKADMKNLYVSLTDAMNRRLESESTNLYEEYLPNEVIEQGIKNRIFFRGMLQVSRNNPQEAHIKTSIKGLNDDEDSAPQDHISISGHPNRNRAIHGDLVAVQLLPEAEWPTDEQTQVKRPKGRVVGVLQRNWRDYVVSIQVDEGERSTDKNILCIPLDFRIPKIRITTRQRDALESARIVVRINSWDSNSNYPNGFYVRTLGPIGDLNVETEGLLIENGLDQVFKFSSQALKELPTHTDENPYTISSKEISLRRDIRKTHMVTSIDPIGCEDIDDALSVRFLPNSNVEIGVHIADVSHYVKHESNLDLEARARSTTIYLVDRRLDMLPALLSSDLCSLRMGVDRLAVSVFWEFKRTGEVVNTWYGRTVIRSRYALHYAQAQNIINGVEAPPVPPTPGVNWEEAVIAEEDLPELKKCLTALQQFARLVRQRRTKAGAVELEALDEVKIKLDESKEVKEIETKQDLEIHHTVAEWMIFANSAVATKIYDCYPRSAILRRHPFPKLDNFKALIHVAESMGFTMKVDSNHALADSLEKAVDPSDPYVNLLLRAMATKAMEEAVYFSTGSFEPADFVHYGLALQFYTHFTSPIRRYADILAHRMLLLAIEQEKSSQAYQQLMEHKKLAQLCTHLNERHRASKLVQSDSSDWFRALYIRKKENLIEDAIIYDVKAESLYVFVPAYRIKSVVHMTTKEGELIVPLTEQKEYNVMENEPLGVTSSNSDVLFNTEYNDKKLSLAITVTAKEKNKTVKKQYPFKIFNHVRVRLSTNESRAHLPKVHVELASFQSSKTAESSSTSVKKQLAEYSQQILQETLENTYKLQDTGYEQSARNVQHFLANIRHDSQVTTSNTHEDARAAPSSSSSSSSEKYSQDELQKKLKAVNNRLKQIEKIKQKVASNVDLTDEEKEKLASEAKYLTHLKKLQKLLPKT